MDYDELTIEAKSVLLTLYKAYCQKTESGQSRLIARKFLTLDNVYKLYFHDWSNKDDLKDILSELSRKKWIITGVGNNTIISIELSTEAVAKLQTRFTTNVHEIISKLLKLKSLLT